MVCPRPNTIFMKFVWIHKSKLYIHMWKYLQLVRNYELTEVFVQKCLYRWKLQVKRLNFLAFVVISQFIYCIFVIYTLMSKIKGIHKINTQYNADVRHPIILRIKSMLNLISLPYNIYFVVFSLKAVIYFFSMYIALWIWKPYVVKF